MSDTSKATPSLFPRNVVIVGGENDLELFFVPDVCAIEAA